MVLYYPVDAPLERAWLEILTAVDVAVAFTEYGRAETRKALGQSLYPVEVVPHGADAVFKAISVEHRELARSIELQIQPPPDANQNSKPKVQIVQFVEPDTFLMLNVNKNEWRKGPLRSLEIVAGLRELKVPAKLSCGWTRLPGWAGCSWTWRRRSLG